MYTFALVCGRECGLPRPCDGCDGCVAYPLAAIVCHVELIVFWGTQCVGLCASGVGWRSRDLIRICLLTLLCLLALFTVSPLAVQLHVPHC